METVACNLCGSTRHTALYQMPDRRGYQAGIFTVVECDRCGLGFVNPRPTFEDIMHSSSLESVSGEHPPRKFANRLSSAQNARRMRPGQPAPRRRHQVWERSTGDLLMATGQARLYNKADVVNGVCASDARLN
jgi:hypothetical protein